MKPILDALFPKSDEPDLDTFSRSAASLLPTQIVLITYVDCDMSAERHLLPIALTFRDVRIC